MNIVFIGSGNLATHLSQALKSAGHSILQVYSRTEAHAAQLALKLGCSHTSQFESVRPDAEAYILAVNDDAIAPLVSGLALNNPDALYIHTAGSVSIDVFLGHASRYGVLYPMQTFSKSRPVDFGPVPCFIEGSDAAVLSQLQSLAGSISTQVIPADSQKRKHLHLAAVLACNLTNHCYRLAERVLEQEDIDFRLYLPLIQETADKVSSLSPREAQTGPMVRYDVGVMDLQLSLLPDERTRQIYRLMAESIHEDAASR